MAVHIRLARHGAKKSPFYRIVVADHRSPRDGRFIESMGTYNPTAQPVALKVERARIAYWKSNGAQTSATVERLLRLDAESAS